MRISWASRVSNTALRALVLFVALPAGVHGQGAPQPLTGELAVNTVITGSQSGPAVSMSANGTHVVVWSTASTSANNDVAQRRFPGDGTTPFAQSLLNQETDAQQAGPAIDLNSAGNFVAVWTTTVDGQGLRARTATNGQLVNEFEVAESTDISNSHVRVGRAEDGSWVAVWDGAGPTARRFDNSGTPVTGEVPIAVGLDFPRDPAVAAVADGEFWVVFQTTDGQTTGIHRERYDALGVQIGDSQAVAESDERTLFSADIDAAGDGSFVVAWLDSELGVRARCFDADGAPRSDELAVDAATAQSRIAVAADGAFVVTWNGAEIGAREYDRTCRPVGGPFTVNTITASSQSGADVATSHDRYVVVWHGFGSGGDSSSDGIARRLFRRRSVYADDFESNDLASWSATAP